MTNKKASAASPTLPANAFYRQLHPVLRERLGDLLDDLREKGWRPTVPALGGQRATGFRSLGAQAKALADGRSGVGFGFHNIRTPGGQPNSMAVHVTEPSQYGSDAKLKKQFQRDLLTVAERYGMTTGLYWKAKNKKGQIVSKPDELHVQLGENQWLGSKAQRRGLQRGIIPPIRAPLINQPKISRALAEGVHLKSISDTSTFQTKPLWSTPKPVQITRPQLDTRTTLSNPRVGRVKQPSWANQTRAPFRDSGRAFTKPTGFNLTLKRPEILRNTGTFGSDRMKLTLPKLGTGLGLGGRPKPSFGFQLKFKPR